MSDKKIIEDLYLGDGVYASFDGYHVWLDTRAQAPISRIALEPHVLDHFDAFRRILGRKLEELRKLADEERP